MPDLWRSFLFIVLRTVPLMLLAGLLGATMAHLIPLESLGGWQVSLTAMAAVALVGTFAPVPIAFDVVIVQALLMAGLPPPFAMVLLLTLGLFSIYPFMLVARMQTLRLSVQLFLVVTVLGFTTGYGSLAYEEYAAAREARLFAARFEGRGTPAAGGVMTAEAREIPARPEVEPESSPAPRVRPESAASSATGITWRGEAYAPRSAAGELPFTRHSGRAWGLRTAEPETMDFMLPFSQGRGIAAADFDGDGWPDLAVANNNGLALYRNIGGKGFEAVPLGAASLDGVNVVLVAFADFNDDGCPDLYAGAVGDADFIVANDCNGFAAAQVFELPHEGTFITQAAAFADIDADGDLDILRGSWFFLIPRVAPSPRDRNYLALNQGAFRFEQRALDEIHGETLSVLWSDLDANGLTDMVIGNDYQEPDIYYRGKGAGEFERLAAGGPVPISTNATMSIDSADIDNDGEFELFLSGKVNDFSMRREVSDPATSLEEKRGLLLQHRADFQHRYCALFEDPDDQDFCRKRFVLGDAVRRSTLDACSDRPTAARQDANQVVPAVDGRLTRELLVTVSAGETSPVALQAGGGKVWEDSRGAQLKIPFTRGGPFTGAMSIVPRGLPPNVNAPAVNLGANAAGGEVQVNLTANTPTGTYTFYLDAIAQQVDYSRNPEAAAAAAERKKEVDQIKLQADAEAKAATDAKAAADKLATDTTNAANTARTAKAAADKLAT